MEPYHLHVDFARGKWDPSEWLAFKSVRWEYTGAFEQCDDHIVNRCPEGLDDAALYADHVTEMYASIVHPKKLSGNVTVSSTMSFDHLMAPLIVITPELDTDDKGRHAYKRHFEIVLYNEGVNVWHYRYEDGKLSWYLAAFARAKFEAGRKYELKVQLQKGRNSPRMTISCGDVTFGYESAELCDSFYAGVTGCEGRNRFYDYTVDVREEDFDPAADGEH